MKPFLVVLAMVLLSVGAAAQKMKLENDTLYFRSSRFYEGQYVKLGPLPVFNRTYEFVEFGNTAAGRQAATFKDSNKILQVDKIIKSGRRFYLRARAVHAGPLLGYRYFIELQPAVDNKELLFDEAD